ncbi:AraC family transcriptional regulator [Sunxiuqinia indica]|uniref:AraC family transcriptional regulator n=1 Tax=Sunxiuqinia indica TaxID=2692584 RepID=UPI001359B4C1|nr:AraC family transcriptional regulator [Sunxiuqinia indica]
MENLTPHSTLNQKNKSGNHGIWWHENDPGPLETTPYIRQYGSMKFSKVRMDETMFPHLNDGIEIHFVNSGKYKWVVEGNEIELLPDNLSITAPWQLNGSPGGKMDIGEITWIVIKPEQYAINTPLQLGSWTRLSKEFQESLGNLLIHEGAIVIKKAKIFKKYFVELKKELTNQQSGFEIMVGNIIENLFIELHRNLSFRKQKIEHEDSFIEKLNQIINADLNKKWVIDDLAHQFGMGKTKFTKEVKELSGYPPNSYIINLKIEKAIDLMKDDQTSLSDIAYACGFSSLQHFTSIFSQRIGISPGKYKKTRPPQQHT